MTKNEFKTWYSAVRACITGGRTPRRRPFGAPHIVPGGSFVIAFIDSHGESHTKPDLVALSTEIATWRFEPMNPSGPGMARIWAFDDLEQAARARRSGARQTARLSIETSRASRLQAARQGFRIPA
jgi:hypothetical protein